MLCINYRSGFAGLEKHPVMHEIIQHTRTRTRHEDIAQMALVVEMVVVVVAQEKWIGGM